MSNDDKQPESDDGADVRKLRADAREAAAMRALESKVDDLAKSERPGGARAKGPMPDPVPGISTAAIPATSNGQESAGRRAADELLVQQQAGAAPLPVDPLPDDQARALGNHLLGKVSPPPAPERMLRFFRYEHLKPELQGASAPFCELARWLCSSQPASPERTKSLNALIEAKDWAVRALVPE